MTSIDFDSLENKIKETYISLGGDVRIGKMYRLDRELKSRFLFQLKTKGKDNKEQLRFVKSFVENEAKRMIAIQENTKGGLTRTTPIPLPLPSAGMSFPLAENYKSKLEIEKRIPSERGSGTNIDDYRRSLGEIISSKYADMK